MYIYNYPHMPLIRLIHPNLFIQFYLIDEELKFDEYFSSTVFMMNFEYSKQIEFWQKWPWTYR